MHRWRFATLGGLIVVSSAVLAAPSAIAERYDANGLRFLGILEGSPTPHVGADVSVSTIRGSLRRISIRAVRDVRLSVPYGAEGRKVGSISVSATRGALDGPGLGTFDLVMPHRQSGGDVRLLRRGKLTVVLSTRRRAPSGRRILIQVDGLPSRADSVGVIFSGPGRGMLAALHRCPVRPTLEVYAVRAGAAPAGSISGTRCR